MSTYKEMRKKRSKESYGAGLFKALFYLILLCGVIVILLALFVGPLNIYLSIGINTMLFPFAFKFMESVIKLLEKIADQSS